MPKISKRLVDAIRPDPSGREVYAWDSELKGFGVRMMPTGVASYFVYYRTNEGRQRKLTIGRVGTLTPDEARQIAREKLTEATKGADPSSDRHKVRRSVSVAELCDLYVEDVAGRVKASTLAMDRSRIERHVKPLMGRRSVLGLTHEDVAKMQADIIAGRTAAERTGRGGTTTGGKGVASRTVGMLGTILEFARRRKIVTENVARGIERPPEGKQRRYLTVDEIRCLGVAMREALEEGENPTAIAAVRFLLLTGCRRMEALGLQTKAVDRRASCLRLADTKSGAQIRPAGSAALAVLEETEHRNGWVFPAARGGGHFVGLPKALDRLCQRAGLEGVTVHVLRHSFAATAAEMGFSELTIAGLLGHSVPGVTARYAHVPDSALVAASDRVSARIAAALDGRSETVSVVRLYSGKNI